MKRFFTLTLVICMMSAFGQVSIANIVKDDKTVVFLGVDFRKAKFIGSTGFTNASKIQNLYLPKWNLIFIDEFEKYALQEVLKLSEENYKVSIDAMIKLNESIVVKDNITNEMDYELDEETVLTMVKDYKSKRTDGIGIAYIVEKFDKIKEKATIHVVLLDLSNNEVFFTKEVVLKPGGFGVENFWSRTLYLVKAEYFPYWYKDWKKAFKKSK